MYLTPYLAASKQVPIVDIHQNNTNRKILPQAWHNLKNTNSIIICKNILLVVNI